MVPERKVVPDRNRSWDSAPFALADAMALKALEAGTADADQQQRALHWIVHAGARVNRMSFDPDSPRGSDFAEGRRFLGLQILRLVTTPVEDLEREAKKGPSNAGRKPRGRGR